jgi:hypothetical protein
MRINSAHRRLRAARYELSGIAAPSCASPAEEGLHSWLSGQA